MCTNLVETVEKRVLWRNRAESAAREPILANLSGQAGGGNVKEVTKLGQLF